MSRCESDEDVPRHRGRGGRAKPWRVEAKMDPRGWNSRIFGRLFEWFATGRYATERDARAGFAAHAKKRLMREPYYAAVRLINPEGEVIAEHRAPHPDSRISGISEPSSRTTEK